MSTKYEITKHTMTIDIRRLSDSHACAFTPKKVWKDMGSTYQSDDDEVKSNAKKEGDVKVAAKGWQEEAYDWDAELKRVFGEVDSDVKTAITSHFTSDVTAKWIAQQKGE